MSWEDLTFNEQAEAEGLVLRFVEARLALQPEPRRRLGAAFREVMARAVARQGSYKRPLQLFPALSAEPEIHILTVERYLAKGRREARLARLLAALGMKTGPAPSRDADPKPGGALGPPGT